MMHGTYPNAQTYRKSLMELLVPIELAGIGKFHETLSIVLEFLIPLIERSFLVLILVLKYTIY